MAFGWLLRELAGHAARKAMQDAVGQAARSKPGEPADEQESDDESPLARPCDVGVVFALPIEAAGFIERLTGKLSIQGPPIVLRQGGLQGRNVVVATSGPGQTKAAEATDLLILGHRPQWIISAGFAGGLADELRVGHFLLPDRILNAQGESLAIDFRLDPSTAEGRSNLHVGPLLTVDRIVRLPKAKRALGNKHGALAVDMETYAVATTCQTRQTRCLSVRVITDSVDQELPPDLGHLMAQKSTMGKLGAVTGALFRRPASALDLWKLKETADQASERLAKFLAEIIVQLAPLTPTNA